MLKVERHKQFIKDLKKANLSDQHFSKFITYLADLTCKLIVSVADLKHRQEAYD